jgi:hypothetical protein
MKVEFAKVLNDVLGDSWGTISTDANGNGEIYVEKCSNQPIHNHTKATLKTIILAGGNLIKAMEIFVTMCGKDAYGSLKTDGITPLNWTSEETKKTKFLHNVRLLKLNNNIAII